MPQLDLMPAATAVGLLVQEVPDDRLGDPTPCPDYTVGDLVEHIGGLAVAFTAAAQKDLGAFTNSAPQPDAARLTPDWRTRISADLTALAVAWQQPEAWTGMTRAGGVDLPGEVGGLVALDEIVLHGWDLAVATGQGFQVEPDLLTAVHGFVASFDPDPDAQNRLFGPIVAVPGDAPLLDRVLGLAGRDPAWPRG
ncbi:TIGR03086 family metal-binding protein [Nakamurella sp.]|uniref:TIGR03086 family metal-binding protein n=1 Tax=Nakamurella sp. TaxID=1869182 RepID=UPI0037839577